MKLLQAVALALAMSLSAGSYAAPPKQSAKATSSKSAKTKGAKSKAAKGGKKALAAPKKQPYVHVGPKIDYEGEQVNFGEWAAVNAFADEIALRHGFVRSELAELIANIRYIDSAVQLVKPAPPGKPKNWAGYRELTIEPIRIKAGVRFWDEHAATLARAESEYGVPAEIIAGIIGVETVYGRDTGRFRVIDVLTTLAFAYPDTPNRVARMAFFRNELENALLLARQNRVDPFSLLGSFAGAIGWPQFMPGSILAYGVDYDRDGVIDLRTSPVDAIGSVANFLVQHGWQRQHKGPLVYSARVSDNRAWEKYINQGLAARFTEDELVESGVAVDGPLPKGMLFGLVDLQNGADPTDYWLANDNFFAITQYNRSYFYAMAVIELGRAVRESRAAQAAE
jgi:membrane-bound lytic murein transglycosylase B